MPWPGIKPGTPRWEHLQFISSKQLFFLSGHTGLAVKFSQELATLTGSQNRAFAAVSISSRGAGYCLI
jgi:hypothetical protein